MTFVVVLPKVRNLHLIMKNVNKSKMRDIFQNSWPTVFKNPTFTEDQRRPRSHDNDMQCVNLHPRPK